MLNLLRIIKRENKLYQEYDPDNFNFMDYQPISQFYDTPDASIESSTQAQTPSYRTKVFETVSQQFKKKNTGKIKPDKEPDPNFFQKTGQFFNKTANTISNNADKINAISGAVGSIGSMFGKGQSTYDGPHGDLRAGVEQGWNAVSDAVGQFGPYGKAAQVGMQAIGALNSLQGAIFGATDGMTKQDALLDSPLGFLTGVGWINQAFGKKSDTITKNEEAFAQVGSSYGGSSAAVDNALNYSGKKYGAFSSAARKDANALMAESRRQQNMVENVGAEASNRFALAGSMASINGSARGLAVQGGYQQNAVHVGKQGMKLQKLHQIAVQSQYNKIMKQGGVIIKDIIEEPSIIKISEVIEEFKDGGTISVQPSVIKISNEIEIFEKGGSFNVIPEGALHARLHHMENAEDLTKKGIPVVSEKEGGELEQQAEIERQEIIFRLEVTKKLEELAKDGSNEAAIEAGKLLTQEILYNTQDNTGLINEIN